MKQILITLFIACTLSAGGQYVDTTSRLMIASSYPAYYFAEKKFTFQVYSEHSIVLEIDTAGRLFIYDTLQSVKEIFRYLKGEKDSTFQWLNKLSQAEKVLKYINKDGFLIDREKYLKALKEYKQ